MANQKTRKKNGNGNANGTVENGSILERFARNAAMATGRPAAFLTACAVVVIWAVTGPIFDYSNTWQLFINTGTTIATFLMVFLIQRSQNRDTMALQAKLAELVIAARGAKNKVAMAEDLSEHELEMLHDQHSEEAQTRLDRLERAAASARSGKQRKN